MKRMKSLLKEFYQQSNGSYYKSEKLKEKGKDANKHDSLANTIHAIEPQPPSQESSKRLVESAQNHSTPEFSTALMETSRHDTLSNHPPKDLAQKRIGIETEASKPSHQTSPSLGACSKGITSIALSSAGTSSNDKKIHETVIFCQEVNSEELSCSMTVGTQNLNPSHINFFLPKLDFSCRCEDCQQCLRGKDYKQIFVSDILRAWQAEFLSSVGIVSLQQLIRKTRRNKSSLSEAMILWREQKNMDFMNKKCCSIALHIWSRAARVIVSKLQAETKDCVVNEFHVFDDDTSVSTLGCPHELELDMNATP
jgi:hypothetical protein